MALATPEAAAVPARSSGRGALGGALAFLQWSRRLSLADAALLLGLLGAATDLFHFARYAGGAVEHAARISLSPWALPRYALFSVSRCLIALGLSFIFALAYGYWAAKDDAARKILIPLLDVFQSVPVLGFMPGLVLAFLSLFPERNLGLELAAIVMIFTAQVWNLAFSFYYSLTSIPHDLSEAARSYGFGAAARFSSLELPSSAIGLVWNGMMSMAGGWFFLMISESFVLGRQSFMLPGLGSYMATAVARGDVRATILAVAAMGAVIIVLDQILWRPLTVWARKFRLEESASGPEGASWFLALLRRTKLPTLWMIVLRKIGRKVGAHPFKFLNSSLRRGDDPGHPVRMPRFSRLISRLSLLLILLVLAGGTLKAVSLFKEVSLASWASIIGASSLTLGRVLAAAGLGTIIMFPLGLWIGLSPRLSATLGPILQIGASFPAPLLFPAAVAILKAAGVGLGIGSVLLMLLGTQWYILFNVAAGASAIPSDLLEAATSYGLAGLARLRHVYWPAVFPYLVTGWVTAAGGAWNASIVAEYVTFKGHVLSTWGLGSAITRAAESADFPALAASVFSMSAVVLLFNRLVWRRLHVIAQERFSIR